jgi:hypothetical protein
MPFVAIDIAAMSKLGFDPPCDSIECPFLTRLDTVHRRRLIEAGFGLGSITYGKRCRGAAERSR